MPFLFLSPSTQYFNPYITTGDERYWMNALADEMTPYLHASGITVTRERTRTAAPRSPSAIPTHPRQDFHLALHSKRRAAGAVRPSARRGHLLLSDERGRASHGEHSGR